jgi:hypothetical protein
MQLEENLTRKRGGLLWDKAFSRFGFPVGPRPHRELSDTASDAAYIEATAYYTQVAAVSADWVDLGVYALFDTESNDVTHITGLELINREQPNTLIGYGLPGGRARQEIIDIHLLTFEGFTVSGKSGRIYGIQGLHEQKKSRWIGKSRGAFRLLSLALLISVASKHTFM